MGFVGVAAIARLSWPAREAGVPLAAEGAQRYVWNRDSLWTALEATFSNQRAEGCANERLTTATVASLESELVRLGANRVPATDPALDSLENAYFALAPHALRRVVRSPTTMSRSRAGCARSSSGSRRLGTFPIDKSAIVSTSPSTVRERQ